MIKYFGIFAFCITSLILFQASNTNKKLVFDKVTGLIQTKDTLTFDDGPYILIGKDSLIEHTIIQGDVKTRHLSMNAMPIEFPIEHSVYKNVSNIAAFSDIHGQYDLAITILKNNKIIDAQLNWNFGTGHLVIVGDIFDRGSKVTELLWFFYHLEAQAKSKGGMVHYLLGNHEYMVMQNDLRYVNPKYNTTSTLLNTPYDELFGKQTILGRWLRSKSTILQINDHLFVHGGISNEFLANGFDVEKTNQNMRQALYEERPVSKLDSIYGTYFDSNGPIWYRGYFSEEIKHEEIDQILHTLNVKHIVVGHTSQTEVTALFHQKILAVDSSIKLGKNGEILLIEDGNYFRGTMDGSKIHIE